MRPLLIAALASLCIAVPAIAGDGVTITRNPDGSVTIEGGQRTAPKPPTQEEIDARLAAQEQRYKSSVAPAIQRQNEAAARNYDAEQARKASEERAAASRRDASERELERLQNTAKTYERRANQESNGWWNNHYKEGQREAQQKADELRRDLARQKP